MMATCEGQAWAQGGAVSGVWAACAEDVIVLSFFMIKGVFGNGMRVLFLRERLDVGRLVVPGRSCLMWKQLCFISGRRCV
jgi:hypothetical protein